MRLSLQLAVKPVVTLCLWAAVLGPAAHARPDDERRELLSPAQGQALAEFAQQSGPRVRPRPDCSHLVHQLYWRAGLVYNYEGSRTLHRGVPDFERVKTPQPGDLVVWLGHVGIVLSPEDKTFLSSVRSGIITESWDGDYWSARGRPRFFRYVIGPRTDLSVLAGLAAPPGDVDPGQEPARPRSLPEAGRPGVSADSASSRPFSPADDADAETTSVIATLHQHHKPDKPEIATALRQGENALARQFLAGQSFNPERPLSVLERLQVVSVKIKRDAGTITVKLTETLTLDHGRAVAGNIVERQLVLERQNDSWLISDPHQRLYLSRDRAIEVFERQAALALQTAAVRNDKRGIIKALNLLYDREPPSPTPRAEARKR